ncbi:DUF6488 family protein [Cellvibrio mixtus]|uniref:DUF6488 family protein n=1 Tax=Cellvibrio mixtus TaxID=39650 RepID=UPI000587E60A|nr:DUF6488 family protein [Cellvibrio mixtus]
MKYFLRITMICICSLLGLAVYGHEGHEHGPVSIKSALEISIKTAGRYAGKLSPYEAGKLANSWANLSRDDAKIHENKLGYYVVSLNNPQENKILYIKILLDGSIAGANYSGNFQAVSAPSSSLPVSGG